MSAPEQITAPWDFAYPAWFDRALCAQTDPDSFFPDHGRIDYAPKRTCGRCPVATQCLTYALEHDIRHGVWGGLNEKERSRLRGRVA
jgi:WhiB family redox-sensing transcriptional regulator